MLPEDDLFAREKLNSRKRDSEGNLLVARHSNPLLDNHVYKVEFHDGTTNEYATNLIVDKLYSLTNPDGNEFMFI